MATIQPASDELNQPLAGIGFIVLGMACISINDALIKLLSERYPLHQIVFFRSLVAILISFAIVRAEGGLQILRTTRPGLHLLRAMLIVVANLTFFLGLAAMPLAEATAIFFVAPLFITLLSVPMLGERVGARRLLAVVAGFVGVLIMVGPGTEAGSPGLAVSLLPVFAALSYALFQILTRKLGAISKASAMAVYIQGAFIAVGIGFFAVAGDGRFAEGLETASLVFLLRAWAWPQGADMAVLAGLGLVSGAIAYALSQAYRLAKAAIIAPFEYVLMPLAAMWGFIIWGEIPDMRSTTGMALIIGSGLYVFWREKRLEKTGPKIRKR